MKLKLTLQRKFGLILLSLFLLTTFVVKPAQAFSTPNISYQVNFENAVFKTDEMNLQSFVYETLKAVAGSFVSFIFCFSCEDDDRGKNPTIFDILRNLTASLFGTPVASGVAYLNHLKQRLNPQQPVYAQNEGRGFEIMEPVRKIWSSFRNLSYLFFVIVLIFMGFAIMFRIKISPQTVVTIQSALPKIILALILITFSYAIVGFMIDIMFVLTAVINEAFIGDQGITRSIGGIEDVVMSLKDLLTPSLSDPIAEGAIASSIFFFFASAAAFGASFLLGPHNLIVGVIAIILVLIAVLRCLWALLKAYAMIVVGLITAPFQILLGVLPGSNAISTWFKTMLANIMVLPLMVTVFHLASYLILSGLEIMLSDLISVLKFFIGTLTGPIAPAFFATVDLQFYVAAVLPLVGLIIALMAPKAADMIKAFLAGQPFGYGTAVGEYVRYTAIPKVAGQIGAAPIATRMLPKPTTPPQWYWKAYEFGRARKWWS